MRPKHHLFQPIRHLLILTMLVTGNLVSAETRTSPAKGEIMLTLESSAFENGAAIPSRYTCQGDDISPPLSWSGIPDTARSLVLIIDDPDAPDPEAPKMTWVHWLLYNLPPDTTGLPEAVSPGALPTGTRGGLNNWQRTAYGGPCPPIGRHRYFHKLYVLDTLLEGLDKPTKAELEAAMQGHILSQVELVGTYQKQAER